jgi:O-antigen biosynthesis protein
VSPYFKPGWNPDLLLSQNVVCHLAVYRRSLVTQQHGLRPVTDGSQDFDLALRATSDLDARRVRHIPHVLYHWRQHPGSASAATAARCRAAAMRAITDHLQARATVSPHPTLANWPAVRFTLKQPAPFVSVVGTAIPTEYDPARLEWIADPAWARGDILVFLAAGLRPITPDWLTELAAQASRPEIGVAGARLLGPDGKLLHAGYTLESALVVQSLTGAADDPGYRGHFQLPRTVSAVSGDYLAVRRLVFEAAGGFTAAAGDYRAVDLCLKLAARGLRTVWTPYAELQYGAPPLALRSGADWVRSRWGRVLADDPYGNSNLRLTQGGVGLARGRQA